jgi:hypothetical protein
MIIDLSIKFKFKLKKESIFVEYLHIGFKNVGSKSKYWASKSKCRATSAINRRPFGESKDN